MRIVRLANFVTPTSGGLRTALRCLGEGYLAAGHEPVLIVPGPSYADSMTPQGRVIVLPGPAVPGLGGYRVLLDRGALRRLLFQLRPDRLEVSDRTTLRWTGSWARRHRVPSVMVSHESLAGLLRVAHLPAALAPPLNRATARSYDRIVCTTEWAAREFDSNVSLVPLGVDLAFFKPGPVKRDGLTLVCCTRLSVEKRPHRALLTLRSLLSQGINARLVMAGDGPLRTHLEREAHDLPVTFTGWIADRTELAHLLASADIALAPGPIETFGLAALEALASGTPVVASASSALPGVIGDAGASVAGEDLSGGVLQLLATPEDVRRKAARARAEQYGWDAAVKGFLRVHEEVGDAHRGPR
ncbi:glycosyltransferase [Allorhizocola rhizosphaerae]|uniref:glycosyltransferase n=1 Tax=Allorhizocola rhizosphaerae TaxID=1872709 RepID=UPI000E3B6EAA|nr:glycosyltransferase [Allorhizocola rhizosphaerae]